jgi:(2Fe-2S) ferredoxin
MSLRERYVLICGNVRPEEDPRGCCARRCPGLVEAFKARIAGKGLKHRFRSLRSSCLDFCADGASVLVLPDRVRYANVQVEDVDEIIDAHLVGGTPVARLLPAAERTPDGG